MIGKTHIPDWMRATVQERDRNQCRYCGETVSQLHVDHVYPESKGGKTVVGNLVIACATCNHKKHAKIGIWPKPIGYFDDNLRKRMISLALNLSKATMAFMCVIEVLFVLAVIFSYFNWLPPEQVYIAVICAAIMALVGLGVFIASKFAWRSVHQAEILPEISGNGQGV